MLHHYNTYTSTLSRFLTGYHHQQQLEDHQNNEDNENPLSGLCEDSSATEEEPRCRSNSSATSKSFTIAAILGLNTNSEHGNICNSSADLSVMNLTVHSAAAADRSTLVNCGRFPHHQLPVNNRPLMPSSTGHFSVSHHHGIISPSSSAKANARNVKNNISSNILQSKKSCKSKRVRTIFTPEQLERLEAEFERQQYMVGPERLYLAHTLQLTEAQVKVWFQNRRIKWRKHHLELTHQRLAVLKQQQLLIDDSSSATQNPDIIHDNNSSDPEN